MEENIRIEGFDKAIIGITHDNILIYDYEIMIKILCENNNLNKEEAEDFLEYNTIRALKYIENAPIIAHINIKPVLLEIENYNGDTLMCCEVDLKYGNLKTQNAALLMWKLIMTVRLKVIVKYACNTTAIHLIIRNSPTIMT